MILFALIPLILILYILITIQSNHAFICKKFIEGNCIVVGKKGKGKDLFFNQVINKRKSKCLSNIQYNPAYCQKKPLSYLKLKNEVGEELKYSDFLRGNFKPTEKKLDECKDYYISDCGVFLPSQCQAELCKDYPSLPITYALSRHLARMNIHANSQALNRIWDKLREQADSYFIIRKSINFGFFFLQKVTFYDDYNRCLQNLRPFKSNKLLSSKENKALYENYTAQNGLIKNMWTIQLKRNIKYDTREFHKIIYGEQAPLTGKKA